MSEDLYLPMAMAVVVLVLLVALAVVIVSWRRDRSRAEAEAIARRAEQDELRHRVDALSRRLETDRGAVRPTTGEFVITDVGDDHPEREVTPTAGRIEGRLFADIVLREAAVKAAALGSGVRRALAAENRNRIRFEMKREVKRARKQRRAELRDLRRERAARQRADEDVA